MKDSTLKEDLQELEDAIEEFVETVLDAYTGWWENGKEKVVPRAKDLAEKIYEKFRN